LKGIKGIMLDLLGAVVVTPATDAIASASTGAGTVIAAGLGFAALWVAYKYGKQIFGKA
jgi:hypothetical protein